MEEDKLYRVINILAFVAQICCIVGGIYLYAKENPNTFWAISAAWFFNLLLISTKQLLENGQ